MLITVFGPPLPWEKSNLTLPERLLFRAALGMGLLSYLILAAGLLGGLNRTVLGVLVLLLALLSLPGGGALLKELAQRGKTRSAKETVHPKPADGRSSPEVKLQGASGAVSWIQTVLAVEVLLLLLLTLIGCASPPIGSDWDGLSYHLADPKLFLRAGRIYPLPWEHHSNFPFLVDMLFTLGLAFRSVVLAKGFHWVMALLTAGALAAAVHRFGRKERKSGTESRSSRTGYGPLLPVALFFGTPLVFWESTVAYIDLGATLYAFLAVYAFTVAMERKEPEDTFPGELDRRADPSSGWLLLAGVMTGFAIGCKTTNGIFLLLFLPWWLWKRRDKHLPVRGGASFLLRFLLPAALLSAPWFVKSILWTGNPVYPFFYGLFGGRYWNAELARTYEIEQAGYGMGRSPLDLLLLPWNLTFHPAPFSIGIGPFASLGPWVLAFFPFLAASRPLPRWTRAFLYVLLGFMVTWVALTQQIRYVLPLLPLICLVAHHTVEHTRINGLRTMGGLSAAGTLLLTLFLGFSYVQPMIPVAFGAMSPEAYLARSPFELVPAYRFINEDLPPNAKILLIEETRGFYLDREYMWGNPGHHTLIPWGSFRTPAQMAGWLKAHGFTHLLLNSRWLRNGWGKTGWEALILNGAESGALRQVFFERGVAVFEVGP